jgi:transposase
MGDYQAMMQGLSELLDLPNVKVTGMQQQGHTIIRLRVMSRSEVGVCPDCGKPSMKVHDSGEEQLIRDLPMWNKRCWLIDKSTKITRRRYVHFPVKPGEPILFSAQWIT